MNNCYSHIFTDNILKIQRILRFAQRYIWPLSYFVFKHQTLWGFWKTEFNFGLAVSETTRTEVLRGKLSCYWQAADKWHVGFMWEANLNVYSHAVIEVNINEQKIKIIVHEHRRLEELEKKSIWFHIVQKCNTSIKTNTLWCYIEYSNCIPEVSSCCGEWELWRSIKSISQISERAYWRCRTMQRCITTSGISWGTRLVLRWR